MKIRILEITKEAIPQASLFKITLSSRHEINMFGLWHGPMVGERKDQKSPDWESDGWADCCPIKKEGRMLSKVSSSAGLVSLQTSGSLCCREGTHRIILLSWAWCELLIATEGRSYKSCDINTWTHTKTSTTRYSWMDHSQNLSRSYTNSLKQPCPPHLVFVLNLFWSKWVRTLL